MTKQLPHKGMRPVIALIGKRNAGKSSLLNRLTDEAVSIVSDTPGTTTDAVMKAYELIPVGAVSFYDTAGLDDKGKLGKLRVEATNKIIKCADLILYVIGKDGLDEKTEKELREMEAADRAFIPVFNFSDKRRLDKDSNAVKALYNGVNVSAKTGDGIEELKQRMAEILAKKDKQKSLISDIISEKDVVVLVTPIDTAAPKGRLIMPQVQVLREVLDKHGIVITTQTEELSKTLASLKQKPKLVITDSQAVQAVSEIVPNTVPVTTFSILFARAKWNFMPMLEGVKTIKKLKNNDRILIAEGCSHRLTCEDIGRIKIPNLIKQYTKKELNFDFCVGQDFPKSLKKYALVIHCGGCMLNQAEATRRIKFCQKQNMPITNYGMVISLIKGVLDRVSAPLIK